LQAFTNKAPDGALFFLENCVDKGGECGPFGKNHKHAKQNKDNEHWQKPELLIDTHEVPQLFKHF